MSATPATDITPSHCDTCSSHSQAVDALPRGGVRRIALLGNPNTGKTTLFNRLTGLRHKTTNFPGATQEAKRGRLRIGRPISALVPQGDCCSGADHDSRADQRSPHSAELVDLPGVYSLELEQSEAAICRDTLEGVREPAPDALLLVLNADNLVRGLALTAEAMRRRIPMTLALNMIDIADRRGLRIDIQALSRAIGCEVVRCNARTGEGVDELRKALASTEAPRRAPVGDAAQVERWSNRLYARVVSGATNDAESATDRIDRVLTNPVVGLCVFSIIMAGLFWAIFRFAIYPMGWIDSVFGRLSGLIAVTLPPGLVRELLAGGVVTGLGATLIFLPQIALLFFCISLLEDTGYLARAAFIMDRMLRPFGLRGHSFVPLLSAHACALPAMIAARAVPDRRERLATILVAPFMTCSARLPVYVLVTTLLFGDRPAMAALAFVGCYFLGAAAGLVSALLVRRTLLRGPGRPMALELPSYKWPSMRNAMLAAYDRSVMFLKQAGTVILAISVILWWLGSFPLTSAPAEAVELRARASAIESQNTGLEPQQMETIRTLRGEASRLEASHAKSMSFAGRIGRFMQPVFAPLGFDWRLTMGVVTSFAAREVFVSTMAIVSTGSEDASDPSVLTSIAQATRDDGHTLIFTTATSWTLLIYFVLAMQCLPTLVVTAREAGGWRWAALQFAWMTGVAYAASLIAHVALTASGVA